MRTSGTSRRITPEAAFIFEALRGEEPAGSHRLMGLAAAVRSWDEVARLSARHGLSPWIMGAISRSAVADAVEPGALATIREHARAFAVTSLALSKPLEEILLSLEAEGVGVVVLKGPVIADRYYPDPGLRPYRDIDLLVPLDCHERVAAACARLGYVIMEDHGGVGAAAGAACLAPFETLFGHLDSGALLDIHYDQLQIGLAPRDSHGIWERSEPWTFQRASARAPALNDLFLLLAVHLHRHGFGRLIWFKDLDLIIRREQTRLDWQWLASSARAEGVAISLGYVLRLLQRMFDTPLPDDASALAKSTRTNLLNRLLWPEESVLALRSGRWRRAVQFVPRDGLRGVLPSLLVMGRRADKIRALLRRQA